MSKTRKLLTSVAVISGVVIAYFGVTNFIYWRDKNLFAQVDRDVGALAENWRAAIPGSIILKSNYCARDEQKFGGGVLHCSIKLKLSLTKQNLNYSNTLEIIGRNVDDKVYAPKLPFSYSHLHERYHYLHQSTGADCFGSYDQPADKLELQFYCIKDARKAVYD